MFDWQKNGPLFAPDGSARGAALKALDGAHHLHPFTDTKALAAEGGTRIIDRAKGVWLWDSDGNKILDGMAGLWCVNVGYGRQELVDAASKQMSRLSFYNTFFKTATEPAVELSEKLVQLTPQGLNHVFFANSGSEANDTVVRIVRHYWNLRGKHRKKTIIGRNYGYHGSTLASVSLCGMAPMHAQADLPLPGFVHIKPPYWFDYGGDLSPEEFGLEAARALEERILELGAETVAAFIAEPIQGAGGVIIPPESYFPEIQRICKKYNVLLIADEVICGFGRIGHWFGSDRYNITPDLMPMAKGITSGYVPLAAVMVGDKVADTLIDKGGEFFHGFTYSGHPVACAVALANIALIEKEGLVERTRDDTGPYLRKRLDKAFADHPLVGEVRTEGLVGAIELVANRKTRKRLPKYGQTGTHCRDECFKRNLVMRAVRDAMVMSPPLTISHKEIDQLVKRAKEAVDATAEAVLS
ncbi:MAG: aspartate aminotransferase family protein [Pseudomonadota bacterium]